MRANELKFHTPSEGVIKIKQNHGFCFISNSNDSLKELIGKLNCFLTSGRANEIQLSGSISETSITWTFEIPQGASFDTGSKVFQCSWKTEIDGELVSDCRMTAGSLGRLFSDRLSELFVKFSRSKAVEKGAWAFPFPLEELNKLKTIVSEIK